MFVRSLCLTYILKRTVYVFLCIYHAVLIFACFIYVSFMFLDSNHWFWTLFLYFHLSWFCLQICSLALYMKMIQFLLMPLLTFWLCISLELGEWLSLCILDKLYLWSWFSHDVSDYLFFSWFLFLVDKVCYHFLRQISKSWHTKLNITEIKWTTQIFSCWCIKIRDSRWNQKEQVPW